jgi:hypothetical protein
MQGALNDAKHDYMTVFHGARLDSSEVLVTMGTVDAKHLDEFAGHPLALDVFVNHGHMGKLNRRKDAFSKKAEFYAKETKTTQKREAVVDRKMLNDIKKEIVESMLVTKKSAKKKYTPKNKNIPKKRKAKLVHLTLPRS